MRLNSAVIFDLDGTLLDSVHDLAAALNKVRLNMSLPAINAEVLRAGVSRGAAGMLPLGFPELGEIEPKKKEQMRQDFLNYYAACSRDYCRAFDGINELLDELQGNGIAWSIVTNKVTALTLPIVAHLGWQEAAAAVICGDTTAKMKPAPDHLFMACKTMGIEPTNTFMVGDDPRDIQSGVAAGCKTVAVHWGYTNMNGVEPVADEQCHTVDELRALLLEGTKKRVTNFVGAL